MCIHGEGLHSRWGTSPLPVRMCISSEDESQWNKHPRWEWGCASPGVHMLTGKKEESHLVYLSINAADLICILTLYKLCAFTVRVCISGESHPHCRRCVFLVRMNHNGINILARNGDVPHRERKFVSFKSSFTPGRESFKFDIFKCLHLVYLNNPRILMTHDKMAVAANVGE